MSEFTATGEVTEAAPVASEREERKRGKRKDKAAKAYGKTAKVGALWTMGREAVTQLIGIPTTIILARLLSPSDFGIAAATFFFIQLGKRMGNLGLNAALVRMKDVREEHRASVFVVNIIYGFLAWATLMLAAPWIGAFYHNDLVTGAVRVAATIFLVNFFGAVEMAVLQRDMKFKEMAFCEWAQPIVFLPVAVTMALTGWGYWSLLIAQLASNAASTVAKVYFGGWKFSLAITRTGLAETFPFGAGVYVKRMLAYAADNLDSFLVGGAFGTTALGYYDKAFNAADNLSSRFSLGATVMFRIFAIIQEERERFLRAYSKVVLAGTIVTLPLFSGLAVAAPEFIVAVFGPQWSPTVVPFQFLCGAGALRLMTNYASSAVQASGRIWGEVFRKLIKVGLVVGLILASRPWGIEGAAFAVFVATLILAVLMQGLVKQIIEITWAESLKPLLPSVGAAIGTAALIAAVRAITLSAAPDIGEWPLLLLDIAAGGVFWLGYTLFAPIATLKTVVDEMIDDLAPSFVKSIVDRIRPRRPREEA